MWNLITPLVGSVGERRLPVAPAAIRLLAGGVMPLEGYAPQGRVACLSGTVWVTQTGDAADHILRAGEVFQSGPRGRVVIQAMQDAMIELR